ncbi:hypothetical protein Hanom_Chr00s000006g01612951 [Helianthus anomalus]
MACYVHDDHKGLPINLGFLSFRVQFDGLLSAFVACLELLEIISYSTVSPHCTRKRPTKTFSNHKRVLHSDKRRYVYQKDSSDAIIYL